MPRYILKLLFNHFKGIAPPLTPAKRSAAANSFKDARIHDKHSGLRGILKLYRIFSDNNKNYFKSLIEEINRESELINKNMNEVMFVFNQKLFIAYNKSFLFKRLSRKTAKDKPWITSGLKQSIKHKHLLYQKYIFDQTKENKTVYKIFKNKFRTVIRKAETEYYKESFIVRPSPKSKVVLL